MYTELDSYAPNGSTYDDFYCGSEDRRSDLSRSPLGVNINAYPMTTIEFEPIPNVFSFPPCTPTIKWVQYFTQISNLILVVLMECHISPVPSVTFIWINNPFCVFLPSLKVFILKLNQQCRYNLVLRQKESFLKWFFTN